MDWVLQFPGRRLIGLRGAAGVAFEIDVDFAARNHRARLRIVFEGGAVNLVKAIRLPSVNHNVDVTKFGSAAILVLNRIGSSNGKQRATALRLRERKPLRALLNVNSELCGQLLQEAPILYSRVKIEACDNGDNGNRQHCKPDPKARNRDRHLYTSYL